MLRHASYKQIFEQDFNEVLIEFGPLNRMLRSTN